MPFESFIGIQGTATVTSSNAPVAPSDGRRHTSRRQIGVGSAHNHRSVEISLEHVPMTESLSVPCVHHRCRLTFRMFVLPLLTRLRG